ncbi:hypothetical protein OB08_11390 [Microbacterium sp. HJ5]
MLALMIGAPAAVFILSLRVRAHATRSELIVRSYLKTYVERFDDVLAFADVAYSGMWNRSADTTSWLNAGLQMIDVSRTDGTGYSLRATMVLRRSSERIVAALNNRLLGSMAGQF